MTSSGYVRAQPPSDRVLRLAGDPDAVARARRLVSSAVGAAHPLHDDCVLLTSEIATNAVRHSASAGGTFTLSVSYSAEWVRVAVQDAGSPEPPFGWRPASPLETGGRGLQLLEALAHRWGFIRESGKNNVWFEMHIELAVRARVPANGGRAAR